MVISLSNLTNKNKKKRKRVGRGNASGSGNYSGRGQKGQRSRSGGRKGLNKLGLKQTLKRIPKKKGFKSMHAKMSTVNIELLNKYFADGNIITFKKLMDLKVVRFSPSGLKVLGKGKINKKLTIKAESFSKSAKEAIVKAGGKAEIIKTQEKE